METKPRASRSWRIVAFWWFLPSQAFRRVLKDVETVWRDQEDRRLKQHRHRLVKIGGIVNLGSGRRTDLLTTAIEVGTMPGDPFGNRRERGFRVM